MSKNVPSLSLRLTTTLILFHFVVACLMLAAISLYIQLSAATSVDDRIPLAIAGSLQPASPTTLAFVPTESLKKLTDVERLWFFARSKNGAIHEHGSIPDIYRGLAEKLPILQQSEIHGIRGQEELAIRTAKVGDIDIMVGGATLQTGLDTFFGIIRAFGLKIIIPPILVTALLIPFLVRRELRNIVRLADQARRIKMHTTDEPLPEALVPREIAPFVEAVNATVATLRDSYEVRERFLIGAAHELRAPIAILDTRIALLPQGELRKALQRDCARLTNLAEQLLDLQRLGSVAHDLETLDLDELARDVVSDMAPLVLASGQDIELERSSRPVMIRGDVFALSRVLFNLIQNASRHGAARGMITVRVLAEGVLEVSDEGAGVTPEERARIFEPFYRVKPGSEGSGLGLHLVKEIVELHGGQVAVVDGRTRGATFRITLNLHDTGHQHTVRPAPPI